MSFRNGFKYQNKLLWVENECLQEMELKGKERWSRNWYFSQEAL